MSNILLISEYIIKHIYSYLKLHDKFTFSLTNRRLHNIFYSYPLLDTIFEIEDSYHSLKNTFLFKNIVIINVIYSEVDNAYLKMFENLRDLDVSRVEFSDFKKVKILVSHLPRSILNVTVMDDNVKELFNLGPSFYKRIFNLRISKKRQSEDFAAMSVSKRIRTPSPACRISDKKLEECILERSHLKYAIIYPEDFVPAEIRQKFSHLQYRAVIDAAPLENIMNNPLVDVIEAAANKLKDLLVLSIVQTQSNNWIFVTQVEVYYHDKKVDDVAQVDKKNEYSEVLTANLEKCQEGGGSWYELCFWCQKFEIVVNGGYYNEENSKLGAFLGVTIPSFMGKDINPILFSPEIPVDTVSCIRMLRNYKKSSSLKKWCFKSSFFSGMGFTSPNQLKLYEQEQDNYVSVCSKLLDLAIYKELNEVKYIALEDRMDRFQYWKNLGFEDVASKEDTIARFETKKKPVKI